MQVRAMSTAVNAANYSTADAHFDESDAAEMHEPSSGAGNERDFAIESPSTGACSINGYESLS